MLTLGLFILIVLLLLWNFKKYAIVLFILSPFFEVLSLGNGSFFRPLMFFSLLLTIKDKKIRDSFLKLFPKYPLRVSLVIFVISSYATTFIINQDQLPLFAQTLTILTEVFFVLQFYLIIKVYPKESIQVAFKTILFAGLVLGVYTIYETIIGYHAYAEYMVNNGYMLRDTIVQDIRFGLLRSQGFFSMHTSNAGVCLFYYGVLLYTLLNTKIDNKIYRTLILITTIILSISIFTTGARSGIVAWAICSFMLLQSNLLKIKHVLILFLFVIVLYLQWNDFFTEIYDSIINSNKFSGSSTDMREKQYDVGLYLLNKSFLLGNGNGYTSVAISRFPDLYYAESIFIPAMIDRGILGIIFIITLFIECFFFAVKTNKYILTYVISGIVLFILTSVPATHPTQIFGFAFLMYTMSKYTNPTQKINGTTNKRYNRYSCL